MGPMVKGPKLSRRRVFKLGAAGLAAMFAWSLIAAPPSVGEDAEPVEPDTVSSYFTFADAVPVQTFSDHQALPAPAFGPGLSHSNTEVSLPSAASAIAWLVDNGIANGLNGTTTGASVPTEVSAKQPGGAPTAEFVAAGGPVGEDEFGRAAAGVARALATHSDAPHGFAHAYMANVALFPAAGSPPEPPGTYDPDATFPGGPGQSPVPDPSSRGQMAIVSIASIASTTESIREGDTVTSIAVAELQGVAIGNRTSDNRCTNCFTIDALRVEAFARSNGQPGGSRAGYRVMLGRACRRTFEPSTVNGIEDSVNGALGQPITPVPPQEVDQCIGNPTDDTYEPGGNYTFSEVNTDTLNDFFAKPVVLQQAGYTIAMRIHAGTNYTAPRRPARISNPPENACRNYAYPNPDPKSKPDKACELFGSKTGPDRDQGQEATAVAEGLDIDILTLTGTQFIPKDANLDSCFSDQIPDQIKEQAAYTTIHDQVGCPIATLKQVRELNFTFGIAQANAVARPSGGIVDDGSGGGGDGGGIIPPDLGGGLGGPILGDGGGNGSPVTIVGGGGLGAGKYALKIDWKSFKLKPWKAKDMAKGILAGAIIAGMVLLIRRRMRLAPS